VTASPRTLAIVTFAMGAGGVVGGGSGVTGGTDGAGVDGSGIAVGVGAGTADGATGAGATGKRGTDVGDEGGGGTLGAVTIVPVAGLNSGGVIGMKVGSGLQVGFSLDQNFFQSDGVFGFDKASESLYVWVMQPLLSATAASAAVTIIRFIVGILPLSSGVSLAQPAFGSPPHFYRWGSLQ